MLRGAEETVLADLRPACARWWGMKRPARLEESAYNPQVPGRACGRRYLFRPGVVL